MLLLHILSIAVVHAITNMIHDRVAQKISRPRFCDYKHSQFLVFICSHVTLSCCFKVIVTRCDLQLQCAASSIRSCNSYAGDVRAVVRTIIQSPPKLAAISLLLEHNNIHVGSISHKSFQATGILCFHKEKVEYSRWPLVRSTSTRRTSTSVVHAPDRLRGDIRVVRVVCML